jgi:DNA polymerase bacteriophage-type
MPRKLFIDIETYSSNDLKTGGVYKYVEAPDFEILLFAYAFDDEPVQVVDFTDYEEIPEDVITALLGGDTELHAHNAAFERTCINKFFNLRIPPERWHCTAVHAAMLGLPFSLDAVAKVLKLAEQKDGDGKALIRHFCIPCKPTKANGMRTRNLPHHAPEKWEKFKAYCKQDVVVERVIYDKIKWYEIPAIEREVWCHDQRVNDRGVLLDMVLVEKAIEVDGEYNDRLRAEAIALTGLDNPNSVSQLTAWLEAETGETVEKLRKDDVKELLATVSQDNAKRVLEIRQQMSKTSIKKYQAMLKCVCADGRARGLLQYYGANRTGRAAGRLIQVQNLPRITLKDIGVARELLCRGAGSLLELLYDSIPDTLSELIRTAFIAPDGKRLLVADFSAIEARVVAWLAGEQWRMDVFNTHGKIYEASASQMFRVPLESITKENPLRQKGKIAELALGYGGGPNALITMGALKQGLEESELKPLVDAWRNANPAIVRLWRKLESAAITCIETGIRQTVKPGITFYVKNNILFIELPSGRTLSYIRPKLEEGMYGKILSYEGLGQGQWRREYTYGGKLCENVTQAVARDCLMYAMLRVAEAAYDVVIHVHDEIVVECDEFDGSLQDVERIMGQAFAWSTGLPLKAEGFESKYYKK